MITDEFDVDGRNRIPLRARSSSDLRHAEHRLGSHRLQGPGDGGAIIVGELGGFHQFPWLFSAYLLGPAVTTPIYADLSDLFGRKPILLLGIALFLACSILCAVAWNRLALIVFRAVQDWPATARIAGKLYLRYGFKRTALLGVALVVVGSSVLLAIAHHPNVAAVAASCFVIGGGMGLLAVPTLIAAQASVEWSGRGVVTGSNMFARSLGSAVGVAVFGAVANSIFGPGDILSVGPTAITAGSAAVFAGVLIVAAASAIAVAAMPRTPPALPSQPS